MSGDFFSASPERGQQTFSAMGQIVNIIGVGRPTSVEQPLNSAVVIRTIRTQPQTRWKRVSLAGLEFTETGRGPDVAGAVVCPPLLYINSCQLKVKSCRSRCGRRNLWLLIHHLYTLEFYFVRKLNERFWGEPRATSDKWSFCWTFLSHTLPFFERKFWLSQGGGLSSDE